MASKLKMAPLLYKLNASPPACAVRMVANIIGLQLDYKEPSIKKMEHKSPEYVKLNPLGTVPVLVDDDFVLADSHAIMIYLLSKYGSDKSETLYPSELRTRALVNQVLFFDTGIFFVRIKVVALPTILGGLRGPSEKQLADLEEAYGMVEAYLSRYKYIAADHLTIADLSVATTLGASQAIIKLDANKFPRTAEWFDRVKQEHFYTQIGLPGMVEFDKVMQACWARNNKQ